MKDFVAHYIAWLIATALFFMIRFWGTGYEVDWVIDGQSLWLMCIACSFIIHLFYGLGLFFTSLPVIRRRPYGTSIIIRVMSVAAGIVFSMVVISSYAWIEGTIAAQDILPDVYMAVTGHNMVTTLSYFTVWAFIISFIKQTSLMVGPSVLWNLIRGKYHFPKEEARVFMFLDLKDSTTHAERLGNTLFFRLIQDCFHDLTGSATKNNVEIYQYVGDEAILTWTMKKGLEKNHCLNVYFDFEATLNAKAAYYEKKYGVVPVFKAGVNCGPVMVAEIGDIKRDIAYLSDVLNTAARIQGKCNELDENLLISGQLMEVLSAPDAFGFKDYGSVTLKGRLEAVEVIGVRKNA